MIEKAIVLVKMDNINNIYSGGVVIDTITVINKNIDIKSYFDKKLKNKENKIFISDSKVKIGWILTPGEYQKFLNSNNSKEYSNIYNKL
jgi:hypothetical protein